MLALKDLDDHLSQDPPIEPAALTAWTKKDKKAQAIIALSLSDELLENVRDVSDAKDMWISIKNVFERHTLLKKLSARRKFYTATMSAEESVLLFSNCIRQYAAILKAMDVPISDSEMSMALLNGLADEFNSIISALDAVDDGEDSLDWELIKSRIMQEEQRIRMRTRSSITKCEAAALLSTETPTNRPVCDHCKKVGHEKHKCWKLHPYLNPHKKTTAAIAKQCQEDEDPTICLLADYEKSKEPVHSGNWFIDSGHDLRQIIILDLFAWKSFSCRARRQKNVESVGKRNYQFDSIGELKIHQVQIRECSVRPRSRIPVALCDNDGQVRSRNVISLSTMLDHSRKHSSRNWNHAT